MSDHPNFEIKNIDFLSIKLDSTIVLTSQYSYIWEIFFHFQITLEGARMGHGTVYYTGTSVDSTVFVS